MSIIRIAPKLPKNMEFSSMDPWKSPFLLAQRSDFWGPKKRHCCSAFEGYCTQVLSILRCPGQVTPPSQRTPGGPRYSPAMSASITRGLTSSERSSICTSQREQPAGCAYSVCFSNKKSPTVIVPYQSSLLTFPSMSICSTDSTHCLSVPGQSMWNDRPPSAISWGKHAVDMSLKHLSGTVGFLVNPKLKISDQTPEVEATGTTRHQRCASFPCFITEGNKANQTCQLHLHPGEKGGILSHHLN